MTDRPVRACLDISQTPRTPFRRLVQVELRKSYDTRAGFWLIAAIGLIVLAAEIIVLAVVTTQDEADLLRRLRRHRRVPHVVPAPGPRDHGRHHRVEPAHRDGDLRARAAPAAW